MNKLLSVCLLLLVGPAWAQTHASLRDGNVCTVMDDGKTLIASAGGLVVVNKTGALDPQRALMGQRVYALVPVPRSPNRFWVGSDAGLAQVHVDAQGVRLVYRVVGPTVRDILVDGPRLWLATWGAGLMRVEDNGRSMRPAPAAAASKARRTTRVVRWQGQLTVGTAGDGLWVLQDQAQRSLPIELPSPVVWDLYPDDSGGLWIATMGGLVHHTTTRTTVVNTHDVRHLERMNGRLWMATFGEGLRPVKTTESSTPLENVRYVSSFSDGSNHACAVTPRGLWIRPRDTAHWRPVRLNSPPSNDIAAADWDGERLWVGTFDQGLATWERNRWREATADGLDNRINQVVVERTATGPRVWVGTARGLWRIENGQSKRLGRLDGLPSTDVHALARSRSGGVLVGTSLGAVHVRGDRIRPLATKSTLRIRTVWAVAEDGKGRRWIGTNQGLVLLEPRRSPRWFTVASGHLDDDWVTAIHTHGDRVWVGTYAGGVSELTIRENGDWDAFQLGGGYINIAGLTRWRGHLFAATMEGLLVRRPGQVKWTRFKDPLLRGDVTGVVPTADGLWVLSRRGLKRWAPETLVLSSAQERH